jgi:peptidylprolyl isomerase
MQKVEPGNFVKVTYKGTLEDGQVFDSNKGDSPLELEVGKGDVIKGFEEGLLGMARNETKTFTVEPENGYGVRDERLLRDFQRSELPDNFNPDKGQIISLQTAEGEKIPATVENTDDEKITIDLNHPLAGIPLTFEVEVHEINARRPDNGSGCGSCSC